MRIRHFVLLVLLALPMLWVCSVGGSGQPVPPPPSDFAVGATVPGWALTTPQAGRGEVRANSTHQNGKWSVVFSRPLKPRPRDLRFSVAVMDDGLAHTGNPLVRFTADPAASALGDLVVCREVSNGHVVPDGVIGPTEWDPLSFNTLELQPQSNLPTGTYPSAGPLGLTTASAYDDEYVYFAFRWFDPSGTKSDKGPVLEWNGSAWVRRPHAANDTNGNGLIGAGETATYSASADDEDRLALFFPVDDSQGAFRNGATGCAVSCHTNLSLAPSGAEAVHAWSAPDQRCDVWQWRAAATAPGKRAEDGLLVAAPFALGFSGGGSGMLPDAGAAPFSVQDGTAPAFMFAVGPPGFVPLVNGPLDFAAGTLSGFPVIPSVASTAIPFIGSNFNNTGLPPVTWSGSAPLFGNDYLPAYVMQQPSDSRADVEVASSHVGGEWVVEFRRRRVTRDSAGAPRQDDVQFDEDAAFAKDAYAVTTALSGLPFSVSLTDRASGHGVRESMYPGPLFLSRDTSLTGTQPTALVIHDYGAGFSPSHASDFTDPRELVPVVTSGADAGLRLKAGTDGGSKLFIVAEWDDVAPDRGRDQWSFDGFFWTQQGDEDEIRILWNGLVPRSAFVSGGGCNYACHAPGGPLGAPQAQHFSTAVLNETADLWRWGSSRTDPIGFADDESLDWSFTDLVEGAGSNGAVHGDLGRAPFASNARAGRTFPVYMAASDPNANAAALTLDVPGFTSAVPFRDVLGNRPPQPTGGGSGVSFTADVLPILQLNCTACHPPFGNLDLQTYAGTLAGGQNGVVVVPGDPNGSLIMKRLTGQIPPQMPLGGPYLSQQDLSTISTWISQGAQNN